MQNVEFRKTEITPAQKIDASTPKTTDANAAPPATQAQVVYGKDHGYITK